MGERCVLFIIPIFQCSIIPFPIRAIRVSLVVFYLPNTLLEALHDSGAGDVDGSGGFLEVGGDFLDWFGFDGGLPEGEPGLFGELPADLAGGAAEELAAVFGVDFGIVGFGVLLKTCEFGGSALARVWSLAAEGVDDCVAGDSCEPGRKRAFFGSDSQRWTAWATERRTAWARSWASASCIPRRRAMR